MAKIKYNLKQNGQATDLMFILDGYVPKAGDIVIDGDRLPNIENLHSIEYKAERDAGLDAKLAIKNVFKLKYQGKTPPDISDADVIEFWRQKMGEDLGL